MKTLKFKSELAEAIVSRDITKTWRMFDEKNLELDDIIQLVNSDNKECFGYARIDKVVIKHLEDIDAEDM